jgi:hypothetical protein
MGSAQSREANFIVQCSSGNLEAVRLIWKELSYDPLANINAHLPDGDFALQLAAVNGHLPIVEFLVEDANCNVDECDEHGLTALMCAIRAGHTDIARYLILDGQANVELADETGCTALMVAAQVGQNETVRLLLQVGAEIDRSDSEGNTALMYSITSQINSTLASVSNTAREDIITQLLLAGADPSIRNISHLTVWDVQRSIGSKASLALMRTAIRKRYRERQQAVFETILCIYKFEGDTVDENRDQFISVAVNTIMEYDNSQQVPAFIIESMTPSNSSRRSSLDSTAILYARQLPISTNEVGYSLISPTADIRDDISNDTVIELGKLDIVTSPSSPSESSRGHLLMHTLPNDSSSMSNLYRESQNHLNRELTSLEIAQNQV